MIWLLLAVTGLTRNFFAKRIVNIHAVFDVFHPVTGELLVRAGRAYRQDNSALADMGINELM
jgi:hypothetical protein